MGDDLGRETHERSITLPVEFERELMEQYPSASRVPEAAKLAIQEAVEARKADLTPTDVYEQVRRALEAVAEESSRGIVVAPVGQDVRVADSDEAVVVEDPEATRAGRGDSEGEGVPGSDDEPDADD